MIRGDSRMDRTLEIIYNGLVKKDYDDVLCIVGDEGKGKSNILLHIVEWWLIKRYGTVTPEMCERFVGMDARSFSSVLSKAKRYDIVADDEAADISSRGAMQQSNQLFMQAYQIIRGDNLFSVLVIPSLFDLDAFFRKRRVKHLIHVYKRGKIAFWSNQRLKRMVELNEKLPFKNYYLVRPTFFDSLPRYEGILKEPYEQMKARKMKKVRINLEKNMNSKDVHKKEAYELKKKGLNYTEIATKIGVSRVTAARYCNDYERMNT